MFLPSHTAPQIHPREREQQAFYRVYLFGQFRLICSNQVIRASMWRRSKAKTLLKWFLLNPGKPCSADQFIDLFWPELPLEAAFSNLYVTIHCLRRLLEPTLHARHESKCIRRQSNNFYWLQIDERWWTDTLEVDHLFDTARHYDSMGETEKALYYYRKVVSYCSLGFLSDDEPEEWLLPHRRHYDSIYAQVLLRLIEIFSQRKAAEEILEYAYQALSLDPYCEPAARAIIDVYLCQGNVPMATEHFNAFGTFIRHELGVEPSKEIVLLGKRIHTARTLEGTPLLTE